MDSNTRLLQAIFFLKDPDFGSLWWVSNKIWQQNPRFVLKADQQGGQHPGVSVLKNRSAFSPLIPMLMGTSRKGYKTIPFKLNDNDTKFCYFGSLRPVDCALACFSSNMITRNHLKPHLSQEDCKKLKNFIREILK